MVILPELVVPNTCTFVEIIKCHAYWNIWTLFETLAAEKRFVLHVTVIWKLVRCLVVQFFKFLSLSILFTDDILLFTKCLKLSRGKIFYLSHIMVGGHEKNSKKLSVTPGLARKKKAGAWSPLVFFCPRRVVSYRWSKK